MINNTSLSPIVLICVLNILECYHQRLDMLWTEENILPFDLRDRRLEMKIRVPISSDFQEGKNTSGGKGLVSGSLLRIGFISHEEQSSFIERGLSEDSYIIIVTLIFVYIKTVGTKRFVLLFSNYNIWIYDWYLVTGISFSIFFFSPPTVQISSFIYRVFL